MKDEANWVDGYIPASGDALDFSAITTATTLAADFGDSREFGAVTMGSGVITFTGSLAATSFSDTGKLALGTNATVTVNGDLMFSGNATHYLAYTICSGAVFRVTGDIINNGTQGLLPCPNRLGTGEFTIAAKGLVSASGAIDTMPQTGGLTVLWEIGEDGISGEKLIGHAMIGSSARFTAKSDFTLAAPMALGGVFTFDTGDRCMITLGDGDGNGWFVREGGMIVDGTGKVVCNCVNTNSYSNYGPYSGNVTIDSGATLEMKPETQLTTGQITVNSDATLALPESGTATLAGNLTLASGAALSFNFTDADTAPVLGMVSGKSVTLNGAKAVTVKISGDVAPSAGSCALTTCGGFGSAVVTLASGAPAWVKGIVKDSGGNLILVCRSAKWTGGAGNGSLSDGDNWEGSVAPSAGDALDFSAITSATTLAADFEDSREFGAVTMGKGVITFTGSLAATSFSDMTKLAIGVDSTVTIDGDLSLPGSGTHYICYQIWTNGILRVTGDIKNTGAGVLRPTQTKNANAYTIAAKGLVAESGNIQPQQDSSETKDVCNWQIGEHGLSGTKLFYRASVNASAPMTAVADFTISAPLSLARPHTLDTGDGYTVTIGDGDGNGGLFKSGRLEISGTGKVVCNCVNTNAYSSGDVAYYGDVTVNSGATLEMKPETQLTTGRITVNSDATLALPESGTVTLAGNLTLASGAALSFNFTDADTAPVLGMVSGKSVTLNGAKAVTVEISGNASTKNAPYVLTSCGGFGSATVSLAAGSLDWAKLSVDDDGNIVLGKKQGFILVVR